MQLADKAKFVNVLKGIAAIKPAVKLTDESYEIYWLALQDWSYEDFRQAAVHLAKSIEFMPNPFHFEQLRKAATTAVCADEWAKVVAVNRGQASRESLSAKTQRVLATMGGWSAIRQMLTSELPFREKRFSELWAEIGDTDEAREALPQIAQQEPPRRLSGSTSAKSLISKLGLERPVKASGEQP